jgi:hypothetical protein
MEIPIDPDLLVLDAAGKVTIDFEDGDSVHDDDFEDDLFKLGEDEEGSEEEEEEEEEDAVQVKRRREEKGKGKAVEVMPEDEEDDEFEEGEFR